jgi:hypothetical protein
VIPNLCAEAVRESAPVGLNVCLNRLVESSRSQSFIEESAPPDTRLLRLACFYNALKFGHTSYSQYLLPTHLLQLDVPIFSFRSTALLDSLDLHHRRRRVVLLSRHH